MATHSPAGLRYSDMPYEELVREAERTDNGLALALVALLDEANEKIEDRDNIITHLASNLGREVFE